MTSHSNWVSRAIPVANLRYLPKHAVRIGGIRGKKGFVTVRLCADWIKRADSKYKILFRGM
jgi:hypothetical protein